jgi:hypothetical protein
MTIDELQNAVRQLLNKRSLRCFLDLNNRAISWPDNVYHHDILRPMIDSGEISEEIIQSINDVNSGAIDYSYRLYSMV